MPNARQIDGTYSILIALRPQSMALKSFGSNPAAFATLHCARFLSSMVFLMLSVMFMTNLLSQYLSLFKYITQYLSCQ
nr:MAG TPA: hypothetical protein [Bacteriophage sp.]